MVKTKHDELEKNINIVFITLAFLVWFGYIMAPSTGVFMLWTGIVSFGLGAFGFYTQRMKMKVRKNVAMIIITLSGSITTYIATNGLFPPIIIIYALIMLLQLVNFLDMKLKRLA